jgi:hypothetical protein
MYVHGLPQADDIVRVKDGKLAGKRAMVTKVRARLVGKTGLLILIRWVIWES